MKKNIIMKLFALILAACFIFSGCGDNVAEEAGGKGVNPNGTGETAEDSLINSDLLEVLNAFKEKREKFSKLNQENLSGNVAIEVSLGDSFGEFMDSVSGESVSSVFDQMGLRSAKLSLDYDRNSDLYSVSGDAYVNNAYIANISAIVNFEKGKEFLYYSSDDLFEGTIGMNMADAFGDVDFGNVNALYDAEAEFLNAMDEILDAEKVAGMLAEYLEAAEAELGEAEESTENVEVEGVSQKLDSVTYTVDEEIANNVAIAVLEKFKDDEDVKETLISFLNASLDLSEAMGEDLDLESALGTGSIDEAYDDMISEVDTMIAELSAKTEFDDTVVDFVLYYSGSEFAGIEMTDGNETVKFVTVRNGNDVATECSITDDYNYGGLKLVGNDKGGVYNGVLTCGESFDDAIEIHIEDFDINELKKGNLDMTVALYGDTLSKADSSNMFADDFAMKFTVKSDYVSSGEVAFSMFDGNGEILTVSAEMTYDDDADKISVPSKYSDINDDDAMDVIGESLMSDGIKSIWDNLKAAGINEQMLFSLFGSMMM